MPGQSALLTSAVRHHRAGRLPQAAALYEQVLALDAHQADALHLLGQIALQQGDTSRAETLLDRAIQVLPSVAQLHLHHGLALRACHRVHDAVAAFAKATTLDPTSAEAHHQLGNALKSLGRYAEAIETLQNAARLSPNHAPIWLNLGVALLETKTLEPAVDAFRHALALEPGRAEAHNILGHTLATLNRNTEARAAFHESLRLRPDNAAAHDNLGRLCKAEGQLDDAVRHFRAALAANPSPTTHSNLLLALNYLPHVPPEEVLAEHRRWNERYASPLLQAAPLQSPSVDGRRLRIGYVSPDFVHHAVAYFIEPVLAAHDKSRFEVYCYSNARTSDRVTTRLRASTEHWRDIASLDDSAAAELIRSDKLDLLIDLAGHTAHNRLLTFARRPAPVQATWLGYPNTTGLDAIDYRITDAITDPVDQTDSFHAEKLVRLPGPFSCYRPDDAAPAVSPLPGAVSGFVTFACFNNFAKVTPEVITLWSRLLMAVPGTRLLLKSRGLCDSQVVDRVRSAFIATGVSPERIIFNGDDLSVHDHLALYHGVDLALDPFPYNGTTTTCEALWMGVPVITLAGRVHAARVGASLLTHLGLTECMAQSAEDYVASALELAHDLPRLSELRRTLRDRMRCSPLLDATGFTRSLEDAFVRMAAREL